MELTIAEQSELDQLETTIERGLQTFYEVGSALLTIRDKRLYRSEYSAFEDYCQERWGFTKTYANYQIAAAEVRANLTTIVVKQLPQNEAQIRPLTSLEPDQQREVWQRAVETAPNGKITAAHVAQVASDYPYGDAQIAEAEDEPLTPYEEAIARREIQRQQQIQVITGSSETNEWYTPAHIIELAREVLGDIDLDPASSPEANDTVRAASYCTIQEDGYTQPWGSTDSPTRVWLNPPYGKEDGERETNAMRWSRKLIGEYQAGRVESAILLVKAALGYEWFEELWRLYPTCLLRKRLSFVRADGSNDGQSKHATALLYLGKDIDGFRSAFQPIGRVILPE